MYIYSPDIKPCLAMVMEVTEWGSLNDPSKLTRLYHIHSVKTEFPASLRKLSYRNTSWLVRLCWSAKDLTVCNCLSRLSLHIKQLWGSQILESKVIWIYFIFIIIHNTISQVYFLTSPAISAKIRATGGFWGLRLLSMDTEKS